jgi:cytochrome c553
MEWPMKRLVLAFTLILVLVALAAAGCAEKEAAVSPPEGEEVVSSCVSCHTDKDLLKEVATPEEKEESEATSGEG